MTRAVGNDTLGVQRVKVVNSLGIGVKGDDRFARSSLALIYSWRCLFAISPTVIQFNRSCYLSKMNLSSRFMIELLIGGIV